MKVMVTLSVGLPGIILVSGCKPHEQGEVLDVRDGTVYEWVRIGGLKWFRTNLAFLPHVHMVSEQSDSLPMYYVYGNESTSVSEAREHSMYSTTRDSMSQPFKEYGVLYNYAAIANSPGVCPEGWRVPSDEDWKSLEVALGMDPQAVDYLGHRHEGNLGRLLKDRKGWANHGNGVDSFGLAIKPAGVCFSGSNYHSEATTAIFWARSRNRFGDAMVREFSCCSSGITRDWADRRDGYSVRCVQ